MWKAIFTLFVVVYTVLNGQSAPVVTQVGSFEILTACNRSVEQPNWHFSDVKSANDVWIGFVCVQLFGKVDAHSP